jgi:anti-sigma B factor antagonist
MLARLHGRHAVPADTSFPILTLKRFWPRVFERLGWAVAKVVAESPAELRLGYNCAMLMTATIERLTGATAVVTLSGAVVLGTSLKAAEAQVQAVIAEGVSKLVIDLANVDHIDSAGLGMLVDIYGALSVKHGVLRLCGVAPNVLKLLQLTGTDGFLAVDASLEDALIAVEP